MELVGSAAASEMGRVGIVEAWEKSFGSEESSEPTESDEEVPSSNVFGNGDDGTENSTEIDFGIQESEVTMASQVAEALAVLRRLSDSVLEREVVGAGVDHAIEKVLSWIQLQMGSVPDDVEAFCEMLQQAAVTLETNEQLENEEAEQCDGETQSTQ